VVARAQQGERVRRIGVLMSNNENDPEAKGWLSGFIQGLQELGWTDGRNARMEIRWAAGSADGMRALAKELVDLESEVILANSTPATAALQRETSRIPIVFVVVVDPVGAGFVASLPRPGGNITGFSNLDASMAGKWLELLTEIAVGVKQVTAMFNPDTAPYVTSYFLPSFKAAARSMMMGTNAAVVHSEAEIETALTSLGRESGRGLVLMPDTFMVVHRARIIMLAARNNVPAVYWISVYARDGGLLSYGADSADIFRRSAAYVDRILRGAKPAELPVQLPVKFEMAVNARTAKVLGLTVPQSILLRADEVIE
jgi:putative ABC transport system substrate-binding protein